MREVHFRLEIVSECHLILSSRSNFRLPESDCFGAKTIVRPESRVECSHQHLVVIGPGSEKCLDKCEVFLAIYTKLPQFTKCPISHLTLEPAQSRVIVLSFNCPRLTFQRNLRNITNGQNLSFKCTPVLSDLILRATCNSNVRILCKMWECEMIALWAGMTSVSPDLLLVPPPTLSSWLLISCDSTSVWAESLSWPHPEQHRCACDHWWPGPGAEWGKPWDGQLWGRDARHTGLSPNMAHSL